MTRRKCDNCGAIRRISYEFRYDSSTYGYLLVFCDTCGEAITKILEEGVQVKK